MSFLQKTTPYLFAFTLFVSASLVFSVQPMLGKMMLPHVGGAPSGWAVTMFFFQTCLLFGYGLAFIFSKLPPFLNILAILAIFLPAAMFLPIAYESGIADSISPWGVFIQLTASTALPFLALSTLAPGLQRIFSFGTHATANDPYYLYAASNLGSFVGLLAYAFVMEPLLGLQAQSEIWMLAFALLFACIILCSVMIFSSRRDLITLTIKTKTPANKTVQSSATPWARRLKWLALAAIPSSLMIGTTTEITTDIASAPMIWVIPLSLYLLTNIIAFAKRHQIKTHHLSTLHLISVLAIICFVALENLSPSYNYYTITIAVAYLATFTITAMLLHALLANDRPETTKLTEFYLFLALGGALGGSFNAFIAPTIFNDVYEFQLVFILSLLLNPLFRQQLPKSILHLSIAIIIGLIIALALMMWGNNNLTLGILIFMILMSAIHLKTLFVSGALCFLFFASPFLDKRLLHIDRNFFGVVKVYNQKLPDHPDKEIKALYHGTTLHGFQAIDEKHALEPLSYYGGAGPVGDIMKTQNPKDIAVLGLGVGQISCYKKTGRHFTYYEIDPHVVDVALDHFSVLKECGYKDIIVGDARLELAKDKNLYDMVVVDTFSSDAIPVHLITREAISLYMSKLKQNGTILINISNRHLDLTQPLSVIADDLGLLYRSKRYNVTKDDPYNFTSEWVVITNNKKIITSLENKGWRAIKSAMRPWTDDYSNFISTLRFLNPSTTDNSQDKDNE